MRRTILFLLALAALTSAPVSPASAGPASDWPAYLNNAKHTSKSASVAITPANAGTLAKAWTFTAPGPTMPGQPGSAFVASPIVYGGRIYIGANTGVFYALKQGTGMIAWSRFLGFVPKSTCNARGIASTATVAIDPVTLK